MSKSPQVQVLVNQKSAFSNPGIILELFKLRLNLLVVITSALGYFIGLQHFDILVFSSLLLGGFLVTGSSNTMNQIIERNLDLKMNRTMKRPLPSGRISIAEAWLISWLSGIGGLLLLYFFVNPLTSILAGLSLFVYVVLYTPMKRVNGFSVFVGAFPGAIPPMLGWVAANGFFGLEAGLLFAIQFMWQFPHFWAIAWTLDEDYKRAGFQMLPSAAGKTGFSAFIILIHSVVLIPVSVMPYIYGITGISMSIVIFLTGVYFAIPAFKLFLSQNDKSAKKLMFLSFLYLPVVLLAFFMDKLL